MVNDATCIATVFLRPDGTVDEAVLTAVREALETLEGVIVDDAPASVPPTASE